LVSRSIKLTVISSLLKEMVCPGCKIFIYCGLFILDMILSLFHDRRSLGCVAFLRSAIEDCYGPFGVRLQERGYLYVPFSGDILNAARLLKYLQLISGAQASLWLVDRELSYPGVGSVFGCSADRAALLSTASNENEIIAKEAVHEAGHLLGLEHCTEDCVMRLSDFQTGAKEKPSFLCPRCSARLKSSMHL
jgi:archaemetzincin